MMIDVRSGLIGVSSALITVLVVTEYYNRPRLQAAVRRALWGVQSMNEEEVK